MAAAAVLQESFYARPVLEVAPALIGCTVVRGGTRGVIVETEAYHEEEPACHAYAGRTPRTSVLFGPGGVAYVYRSYGIHVMLNAVCDVDGVGAAVLIRALRPAAGLATMRRRRLAAARGVKARALDAGADPARTRMIPDRELCSGPGRLTQALGIELADNGTSLASGPVRILHGDGPPAEVVVSTRIGITKATELPWRFSLAGDVNVSRPWPWRGPGGAARGARGARRRARVSRRG